MTRTLALLCTVLAACGDRKPDPPAAHGGAGAAGAARATAGAPTPTNEPPARAAETPAEALERLERAAADMAAKVDAAAAAVETVQRDADHAATAARLADLKREQLALRVRLVQAMEAVVRDARLHPPPRPPGPGPGVVPRQCLDNPFARECR